MINSSMINVAMRGVPSARHGALLSTPPAVDATQFDTVKLRLTEAVPLAHALVAAVAASADIATLAIKGPVLSCYGLRGARPSADADILVAPDRLGELVELLAAYGWRERYERPIARILDDHSVTLTHHDWPCDVDLHWYFPGMLADPAAAFAFLWGGRSTVQLAHCAIPAPRRVDAAAIAALHALRHPESVRHRADLDDLVRRLRANWRPTDAQRLGRLIDSCGAAVTLNPFLADLGVDAAVDSIRTAQLSAWRAYTATHDHGSTGAWLYAIRRAGWRERPQLLLRAVYPTRRELIAEYGSISRRRRWAVRRRRWWRACRALPQAIQVLRGTDRP